MAQEYIEFSEKTLDDAITAACQKFGITSDKLDYEVVDQGSAGFLGFNARNAVIKARIREGEEAQARAVVGDVLGEVHKQSAEEDAAGEDRSGSTGKSRSGRNSRSGKREYGRSGEYSYKAPRRNLGEDAFLGTGAYSEDAKPSHEKKHEEPKVHYSEEQIEEFKKKAIQFISSVFDAMGMKVETTASFDTDENILLLDFEGNDMGILIGKRGQTLDSIQYLVSLVVNRGIEGYVHVKADTENYRERRRKTLENLARNIAYKVKRTRKSVALEPMNPYERRIIHSALQNDHFVTTYSEGEDPYRKVVITLKK